jgi:cell division protease FtsH
LVPDHDPIHKVSIIPRGRALGVTLFLPERDQLSVSKRRLESQISTLFGGRIAEALIFGADAVTTGAQNDIERATDIARNMVTRWGLSEKLGALAYGKEEGEVFLGKTMGQTNEISPETSRQIDAEIRAIIDRNYGRSENILTENLDTLHRMAKALVEYETLDRDQIEAIMAGRDPRPPEDWRDGTTGRTTGEGAGKKAPGSRGLIGPPAEQT